VDTPGETKEGQRALLGRGLYDGFGDTMAQAFEFAVIPVLFGLFGLWLDSLLGTRPLVTVVMLVLGIAGVVARQLYAYKARMDEEEEGKPWTRRRR
jgi:F0F1-type ATP synthase assembly protein I